VRQFIKTFVLGVAEAFVPRRITSGGSAQIVPQSSVSGRALTAVISIMSFLACLTAGIVYMINQSADAWFKDISSEITVQVAPREGVNIDTRLLQVARLISRQKGVTEVRPFTLEESSELLEPWLGALDTLSALPVPRLIAVEIDRNNPPDLALVRRRLATNFRGVTLDDHRHWQAQLQSLTRSVAVGGFGILLLVATATIAVVISAARSAMASNHEIVEVLHFVGARRPFITSEFERHFLALGIRSGLLGATAAGLTFLLTPVVIQLLGGNSVTAAELHQFIGSAELDFGGYMILFSIVVVVAGICMFTSGYWVQRILNTEGTVANPNHSMDAGSGVSSRARKGADSSLPSSTRSLPVRGALFMLKTAGALLLVFAFGFLLFVSRIETTPELLRGEADGIVVLTGGQSRINEAVRLLKRGKGKRLLISGVYARTSRKKLAQLVPEGKPLFDCCIDIGRNAQDTIGNAQETRAWASERRFNTLIVVTSGYHMQRSITEFRRAMPGREFIPYSVQSKNVHMESWWSDMDTLKVLFSEYIKYIPSLTVYGIDRVKNALVGQKKTR